MAEADAHVTFAEVLIHRALNLFPADERPSLPDRTPTGILEEEIAEDAAKKALANAFCDLAQKKGSVIRLGLAPELVLYGTEQELTELVINIDDMNDLNSYLSSRITLPSLG